MKEKIREQNKNFQDCWELIRESLEKKRKLRNDNKVKKLY